jgi:hypothetical protein
MLFFQLNTMRFLTLQLQIAIMINNAFLTPSVFQFFETVINAQAVRSIMQ